MEHADLLHANGEIFKVQGAALNTVTNRNISGKWVTMGVLSDGSYSIPEGLVFGFPVICDTGSYRIVQGLDLSDEFSQKRIAATLTELEEERSVIQDLL